MAFNLNDLSQGELPNNRPRLFICRNLDLPSISCQGISLCLLLNLLDLIFLPLFAPMAAFFNVSEKLVAMSSSSLLHITLCAFELLDRMSLFYR